MMEKEQENKIKTASTVENTPDAPECPENPESPESLESQENPESQESQETQEISESSDHSDHSEPSDPSDHSECSESSAPSEPATAMPWLMPDRPEPVTPADYEAATQLIAKLAEEMGQGEIGTETLSRIVKAVSYDREVAKAGHEGEIRGRNTRIEEYLIEKRTPNSLPDLGRSPAVRRHSLPYDTLGGLTAADRKSIWERGNEKRHRR